MLSYILVFLNVISSVCIILLNKVLFRSWAFTAALTLAHAVATKASTTVMRFSGLFEAKPLPQFAVGKVALFGIMSIVLMNINLLLNPIGVYQASKILVLPATSALESGFYGAVQSSSIWSSLGIIVIGAILSSPSEVFTSFSAASSVSLGGLSVAMVAVVVSAGTVILIGRTQKDLDTSPLNLLEQQQFYVIMYALAMSGACEGTAPWDSLQLTPVVLALIFFTSCMAAILNSSGFYVIKSLSPLTYQVTSHLKTISTLVLGTVFFGEEMTVRQVFGFVVCFLGVVAYTFIKNQESATLLAITSKVAVETVT